MNGPWLAAGVHLFTALGAVCALLATLAVQAHAWQAMFAWLGLAFVIDGCDGVLARAARVDERLPRFSGERLDLIIDYLTYVFIPVLAMLEAGFLAATTGRVLAALMLLASLFHFADTESKAMDHSFVGFPAIWNVFAFYVFAFDPPLPLVLAISLACIVLTFLPMSWVHPVRVRRWRVLTLIVVVVWSLVALKVVATGFPAGVWERIVLFTGLLYGTGLSLLGSVRLKRGRGPTP